MPLLHFFLSALPLASLCLTLLFFYGHDQKLPPFSRIIRGALAWSAFLWLVTNSLSVVNGISPFTLFPLWGLYFLVAAAVLIHFRIKVRLELPRSKIYYFIYFLCAATFVSAIIYPPNNWDVMSYHLPRVMQWLAHHTLAPFDTNIPRQIGMPPFNSMVALQVLAADTDRLVNLPQWFAYLGCIYGCVEVAKLLGASRRAQAWASVFMATLPGALMQATTIESTEMVTFWLIGFAYSFLLWRKAPSRQLAMQTSLCLGFAILTKGSAYPIALPFVVAIAAYCLFKWRSLLAQGLLMALVIVTLNVPHLLRVHAAYGSCFGGTKENILYEPSINTFLVNSLYNFLANESTILSLGGRVLARNFAAGLDVPENNKSIFPWGGIDKTPKFFSFQESAGQNPLNALFLLVLLGAMLFFRFRPPALYTSLVFFSFVSYTLLLTWHPWTARVQLSLFALAVPVCALYLDSWHSARNQRRMVLLLCLYGLGVLCFGTRPISALFNTQKAALLHSREELYFVEPDVRADYLNSVDFLAEHRPQSLGIIAVNNTLEYPLWRLLKDKTGSLPPVAHLKSLPQTGDGPEYVWVQEAGKKTSFQAPRIFKKTADGYIQVFPKAVKE